MGPTNLPPDAAGHLNAGALPGLIVWAGVFFSLVFIAWYLNRDNGGKEE